MTVFQASFQRGTPKIILHIPVNTLLGKRWRARKSW